MSTIYGRPVSDLVALEFYAKNPELFYFGEHGQEVVMLGGTSLPSNFGGSIWPEYGQGFQSVEPYTANPKHQKCTYCGCSQTEYRATCSQCGAPL
jgi:hypothetical protein